MLAGTAAARGASQHVTGRHDKARSRGRQTITTARTAGCAQVQKVEPQFPARLCADLPALDEHGSRYRARTTPARVHECDLGTDSCDDPRIRQAVERSMRPAPLYSA
jgi:hypothetical protein